MTLTIVVGNSGSGKTMLLNDVCKSHHRRCTTYIQQYHHLRPYITVSQIPNFDPKELPYWDIYKREEKAETILVGGMMAGKFTAGLSGGQRKLLLFELIYQRTKSQSNMLIIFDEPFSGVTDDLVPFIEQRLNEMRQRHKILIVTNDHIATLKTLADNIITVSAIDRTKVLVNATKHVDRHSVIVALSSIGEEHQCKSSTAVLRFFYDVELRNNASLKTVAAYVIFNFTLFLISFWNSLEDSAPYVIIAGSMIAFFCLQPYMLSLVAWRNYLNEESEALLHTSKAQNIYLKSTVAGALVLIVSVIEYGVICAVMDGLEDLKYWLALLTDNASMMFVLIGLGLYTTLPIETVQMLGGVPFLFVIFFSTTFSPGSGIDGLKALRYLFPRFYFWCLLPDIQDSMEGCPTTESETLSYMVLAGLVPLVLLKLTTSVNECIREQKKKKTDKQLSTKKKDDEVNDLLTLFGGFSPAPSLDLENR